MLEQINHLTFGIIMVVAIYLVLSSLFLEKSQALPIINQPVISPNTERKIQDLEIQCQRLREELKQQAQQLQSDFQCETFTQLQTFGNQFLKVFFLNDHGGDDYQIAPLPIRSRFQSDIAINKPDFPIGWQQGRHRN